MTDADLEELVTSLTYELGLDPADLDLFELGLGQEFLGRFTALHELFADDTDQLGAELGSLDRDLHQLETHFVGQEEYERSAIVLALRNQLFGKDLPNYF
jgi:hypothetical protein